MKLFTIGPTEMYENTKAVRQKDIPYFRTSEFSADMQLMDKLLKKQLKTSELSQSIYLTASGTGAMEATVQNCFSTKDRLLIINGGSFGNRFAQICEIHNIPYECVMLKPNEALSEKSLEPFYDRDFTGLLVNLHETSTGQLYVIQLLKRFCSENKMYLIVDAISTFLCDDYQMDNWNIDATIISTQKGLCVSPGMSVVILNKRIIEERVKRNKPASIYFNFNDYLLNISRGQTPFTPAVGLVYEILDMVKFIEHYGLENRLSDIAKRAEFYRKNIIGDGITIPEYPLSNAVTPTFFEKPVAMEIFENLKNNHCMTVNPTGGMLAEISFRVSHVGDLTVLDTKKLIEKIKEIYYQK